MRENQEGQDQSLGTGPDREAGPYAEHPVLRVMGQYLTECFWTFRRAPTPAARLSLQQAMLAHEILQTLRPRSGVLDGLRGVSPQELAESFHQMYSPQAATRAELNLP